MVGYMALHSELVQLKDNSVQWTKYGRIIKLNWTLAERKALLFDKDQLFISVVSAIKDERCATKSEEALYRVFKSSE